MHSASYFTELNRYKQISSLKMYLFIFGCAGSSEWHLQLQHVGAPVQLWCMGFSLWHRLLVQSVARPSVAVACGLSSCSSQALESRLSSHAADAPWHVGSSQIRNRTCVFCFGRSTLYHWATRQGPEQFLMWCENWVSTSQTLPQYLKRWINNENQEK